MSASRSPGAACTLAVALASAACRSSTEPAPVTRLAVGVLASPASAALQVPDTVFAGSPFSVRVVTQGDGCLRAAGGEARVKGLTATVTPYDMLYNGACDLILLTAAREVLVRFDAPGTASVRVVGAHGTAAERTVIVRLPRSSTP
jgi:hypothetical protein